MLATFNIDLCIGHRYSDILNAFDILFVSNEQKLYSKNLARISSTFQMLNGAL